MTHLKGLKGDIFSFKFLIINISDSVTMIIPSQSYKFFEQIFRNTTIPPAVISQSVVPKFHLKL